MPTEHTSAEYTLFSLGHGTFSKMDPIPGHETNVQQVQKKKKTLRLHHISFLKTIE